MIGTEFREFAFEQGGDGVDAGGAETLGVGESKVVQSAASQVGSCELVMLDKPPS